MFAENLIHLCPAAVVAHNLSPALKLRLQTHAHNVSPELKRMRMHSDLSRRMWGLLLESRNR
jgi:hypothetical protein